MKPTNLERIFASDINPIYMWSKKSIVSTYFIVFLLGLVSAYYSQLNPLFERQAKQQKAALSVQQNNVEKAQLAKQLMALNQQLKTRETKLLNNSIILLAKVTKLSHQHQINIFSITTNQKDNEKIYPSFNIQISLLGTYQNLLNFLTDLSKNYLFEFYNFSIEQQKNNALNIKLNLHIYLSENTDV